MVVGSGIGNDISLEGLNPWYCGKLGNRMNPRISAYYSYEIFLFQESYFK
jgi:hypothetical protein